MLVVEDSRFASEALRLLCLRSGARIRRADCLKSAHRHLQVYRPTVAIVDIGLQDGSGTELIHDLTSAQPRSTVVIGMSGDLEGETAARAAGADGFLAKPVTSLAKFQETILRHMPPERQPLGPRVVDDEPIDPDPLAYQDDLAHIADLLASVDEGSSTVDYISQFLSGVARSFGDKEILSAVDGLNMRREMGGSLQSELGALRGILDTRLAEKIAM